MTITYVRTDIHAYIHIYEINKITVPAIKHEKCTKYTVQTITREQRLCVKGLKSLNTTKLQFK
jgi:hypothetical protein